MRTATDRYGSGTAVSATLLCTLIRTGPATCSHARGVHS